MSVMFGKVKACNLTVAPERCANECNLVLLGATGSGKSALIVKFLTKRFISEYDPRLEDIYSSEEMVDQQPVVLRVMDTYDQAFTKWLRCSLMVKNALSQDIHAAKFWNNLPENDGPVNTERYVSWASAFIVVYSIENQDSFKVCHKYLDTLSLHKKTCEVPIVLLGNKLDLERYRQVSKSSGEELALRFGCLFYEISACLDFHDVQQIFHEAVRRVRLRGSQCGRPVYISEDKGLVTLPLPPAYATPCLKELPAPATAKLVTVKTSRAQSKRRAATLTLLKGFKIF